MFSKWNTTAEVVLRTGAELGEGAVWDDRCRRLIWVDIERGVLHAFDPETGRDEARELGRPIGVAVPRSAGGFAVAIREGFALLDGFEAEPRLVAGVDGDVPVRMNDGRCDSLGRFWAGSMGLEAEPGAGALYRLDPDHRLHRVLDGVTISNGIDWSPDDRRMYYVDSATQRVDAFDFDRHTGAIANRRPFASIPPDDGEPDGICVDRDGRVWVALWGGARVLCHAPDGRLLGQVTVPVSRVTSCAFGGPRLADLFVTTARADARAEEPAAGGLFRCRTGFRGRVPHAFAG
jgi:sugar lactone lactonase YvrE